MKSGSDNDEGPAERSVEPSWRNPSSEEIQDILKSVKRIAVVGLSSDPGRPSNGVASYLQNQGYEIIPVNPYETEVFGHESFPELGAVPGKVDMVQVFRKSHHAPEIVEDAAKLGISIVWLQEGIVSEEAYRLAQEKGIRIIMDLCMLKEHNRMLLEEEDDEDE